MVSEETPHSAVLNRVNNGFRIRGRCRSSAHAAAGEVERIDNVAVR